MAIPGMNTFTLPISDMISLSLCSRFPPKSSRSFLVFISSSVHRTFSSSSPAICRVKVGDTTIKEAQQKLKNDWVASLSCYPPRLAGDGEWVIGIDPDTRGAVALLKGNSHDSSAKVFDSPNIPMLVGKSVRKRLDTKSIVELLRSFDAPIGTTVYIEQAIPCPQDGKLGWYSGGFGYGQWIGTLVALGFSVIPVSSRLWKKKFELLGSEFQKDDSRRIASTLFPSLSSSLKRKKDHGRADALLIAAYGQSLKMESDAPIVMDELVY